MDHLEAEKSRADLRSIRNQPGKEGATLLGSSIVEGPDSSTPINEFSLTFEDFQRQQERVQFLDDAALVARGVFKAQKAKEAAPPVVVDPAPPSLFDKASNTVASVVKAGWDVVRIKPEDKPVVKIVKGVTYFGAPPLISTIACATEVGQTTETAPNNPAASETSPASVHHTIDLVLSDAEGLISGDPSTLSDIGKQIGKQWPAIINADVYPSDDLENTGALFVLREDVVDDATGKPREDLAFGRLKDGHMELTAYNIAGENTAETYTKTEDGEYVVYTDYRLVYNENTKAVEIDPDQETVSVMIPIQGKMVVDGGSIPILDFNPARSVYILLPGEQKAFPMPGRDVLAKAINTGGDERIHITPTPSGEGTPSGGSTQEAAPSIIDKLDPKAVDDLDTTALGVLATALEKWTKDWDPDKVDLLKPLTEAMEEAGMSDTEIAARIEHFADKGYRIKFDAKTGNVVILNTKGDRVDLESDPPEATPVPSPGIKVDQLPSILGVAELDTDRTVVVEKNGKVVVAISLSEKNPHTLNVNGDVLAAWQNLRTMMTRAFVYNIGLEPDTNTSPRVITLNLPNGETMNINTGASLVTREVDEPGTAEEGWIFAPNGIANHFEATSDGSIIMLVYKQGGINTTHDLMLCINQGLIDLVTPVVLRGELDPRAEGFESKIPGGILIDTGKSKEIILETLVVR